MGILFSNQDHLIITIMILWWGNDKCSGAHMRSKLMQKEGRICFVGNFLSQNVKEKCANIFREMYLYFG